MQSIMIQELNRKCSTLARQFDDRQKTTRLIRAGRITPHVLVGSNAALRIRKKGN